MKAVLLPILSIPVWWCEVLVLLLFAPPLAALCMGWRAWGFWLQALVLFGATGVALQRLIEGPQWQLTPAAMLSCELIAVIAVSWFSSLPISRVFGLIGSLLFIAAVICYCAFPRFALPRPSGKYPIGTIVLHLVDHARRETLGGFPEDYREMMVQVWYPADGSKNQARKEFLGRSRARSAYGAFLSTAKRSYPVLIFSPSWHGQRGENLFQIEDLASHGFVVAGIDHPYSSAVTVFPDGRSARTRLIDFWDLSSDRALKASEDYDEKVMRVRVADVEFLVSELYKLNADDSGSTLSEKLDLSRLGIFGYSFGGAVAAQTCWQDPRFKAGIDMDGTMFGEVANAGVSQPFMFMVEGIKTPTQTELNDDSEKARYNRLNELDLEEQRNSLERHGGYWLSVSGSQHANFTDPPAWPTIGYYLDEAGTIGPMRAMRIVNAYTLSFFEKHLNNRRQPLLSGPSPSYPEVEFGWPPGSQREYLKRG